MTTILEKFKLLNEEKNEKLKKEAIDDLSKFLMEQSSKISVVEIQLVDAEYNVLLQVSEIENIIFKIRYIFVTGNFLKKPRVNLLTICPTKTKENYI